MKLAERTIAFNPIEPEITLRSYLTITYADFCSLFNPV
jgi:hypothetical protein